VSITAASSPNIGVVPRRESSGRRTIRFVALLAAIGVVFGGTVAVRELTRSDSHAAARAAGSDVAMPQSAQIEETWGIVFKSVTLLAATGVIDVRYTVIDTSKADRLHNDGRTGLPKILSDHGVVKPDSVMFHFHSKASENAGQAYDIIYGNAGGALNRGARVTLVMPDGLKLANVPVTE
jgi:hypothetical protein